MSGVHLGHDGKRYFSIKSRGEADRAHAKTSSKGKGDRHRAPKSPNSRGGPVGGGEYTAAEWKDWMAQWDNSRGAAAAPKQPPWEQPALEWRAPNAEAPSAEAPPEITRILADGRFAYASTEDSVWEGVSCLKCHLDWHYRDMFSRLCIACDAQFPEESLSKRLKQNKLAEGEIDTKSPAGILAQGTKPAPVLEAASVLVATTASVAADHRPGP